jgi:4-aminobutyrate aminotransferase-like enzyme
MMKEALHNGVIIDWFLFRPATFRLAPPLTMTMQEIDQACSRLMKSLDTLL